MDNKLFLGLKVVSDFLILIPLFNLGMARTITTIIVTVLFLISNIWLYKRHELLFKNVLVISLYLIFLLSIFYIWYFYQRIDYVLLYFLIIYLLDHAMIGLSVYIGERNIQ